MGASHSIILSVCSDEPRPDGERAMCPQVTSSRVVWRQPLLAYIKRVYQGNTLKEEGKVMEGIGYGNDPNRPPSSSFHLRALDARVRVLRATIRLSIGRLSLTLARSCTSTTLRLSTT